MSNIFILLFQLAILLFSIIIHEVAHGLMALRLGDETAKRAGRLTLNPISHLDPMGSFFVPLFLFLVQSPVLLGWAKPVPYDPRLLYKDYKYGPLKVALAGPAANIIIAIFFGLLARFAVPVLSSATISLFGFVVFLNLLLAVFNLVPIPPLDGSKILTTFLPPRYAISLERMGMGGILLVLVFLFFFFGIIISITSLLFHILVGPTVFTLFFSFFSGG